VSISTSGAVDEVRLYPENALVVTNAYEPGVGVITSSDANDIVSYYYYDTFNRLKEIKDNKGNLLKTFKYHYKD
jgi:YD repeat-containing protein